MPTRRASISRTTSRSPTNDIRKVEMRVNAEILQNTPTRAQVMADRAGEALGAVMLFGEKYGDEVRVLEIGSSAASSAAARTWRAPATSASSRSTRKAGIAAGIRRVEATTGLTALAMLNAQLDEFREVARVLLAQPGPGMAVKAATSLLDERRRWKRKPCACARSS